MKPVSLAVRTEHDSMGPVEVPADACWGAQTQRAVQNFQFSGQTLPGRFIQSLGTIKAAAAEANGMLGLLDADTARAIVEAGEAIAQVGTPTSFRSTSIRPGRVPAPT